MLHIILGILKVIGVILAAVIILLLGIMLSLLYVPVRYKGTVAKTQERMAAQIRITWFFRMISVLFAYDHGQNKKVLEIRIFGISLDTIKKLLRKCKKKKRRPEKTKQPKRAKEDAAENRVQEQSAKQISADEPEELPKQTAVEEPEESLKQISEDESEELSKQISMDEIEELAKEISADESENLSTETQESAKEDTDLSDNRRSFGEKLQTCKEKLYSFYNTGKASVLKIIQLLKTIFTRIRSIGQNIMQIPEKISKGVEKLSEIPEKISYYKRLLEKYEAEELLRTIWKEIRHLLKCYGPRKISGYLRFGTGDPAQTGQILGVMYLLLPAKAGEFSLQPEFTEMVFETDMHIRGHIRACHAAAAAWRLFRNKKLMRAIKGLRKKR